MSFYPYSGVSSSVCFVCEADDLSSFTANQKDPSKGIFQPDTVFDFRVSDRDNDPFDCGKYMMMVVSVTRGILQKRLLCFHCLPVGICFEVPPIRYFARLPVTELVTVRVMLASFHVSVNPELVSDLPHGLLKTEPCEEVLIEVVDG